MPSSLRTPPPQTALKIKDNDPHLVCFLFLQISKKPALLGHFPLSYESIQPFLTHINVTYITTTVLYIITLTYCLRRFGQLL